MTGQFWMRIVEKESGRYPKVKVDYTAIPCMHCDDAAVRRGRLRMGPSTGETDGIVLIDPVKAAGRRSLVSSCPYRVIYWNERSRSPRSAPCAPISWTQGWKEPRCVEACPTGPWSSATSTTRTAKSRGRSRPPPPRRCTRTTPGREVRYVGLPKSFVAGAVVLGDTDACAVGASVTLTGDGRTVETLSDGFGDFEFEGLPANSTYTVTTSLPGYASRELEVRTTTSIYLGDIVLSPIREGA